MPFTSPNFTQTPNDLFDELLPLMTEAELKVVLVVIRGTFGYHKERTTISTRQMAKATGMSESTVLRGAIAAENRKLIRRIPNGRKSLEWEALVSASTIEARRVPLSSRRTASTVEAQVPLSSRHTAPTIEAQSGLNKGKERTKGKESTTPTNATLQVLTDELGITFTRSDRITFENELPNATTEQAKSFIAAWRKDKRSNGYPPSVKQIINLWHAKPASVQHNTGGKKLLPLHRAK